MPGEPDQQHWRDRAKEARAKADKLKDTRSKRILLGLATSYERLAEGCPGGVCVKRKNPNEGTCPASVRRTLNSNEEGPTGAPRQGSPHGKPVPGGLGLRRPATQPGAALLGSLPRLIFRRERCLPSS
jgi:hypothetical protein